MRLVTFRDPQMDRAKPGVLTSDGIIDVSQVIGSVRDLVASGQEGLRKLQGDIAAGRGRVVNPDEVRLLPPLWPPVRCVFGVGLNYASHAEEARGADAQAIPEHPAFFAKPQLSLIGPYDPIAIDEELSRQWDYEGELAVVIGRAGRSIPEGQALRHVFGYMVANDVSARDLQLRHGGQWLKGKAIDGTCPIGPCIVTADELGDGSGLVLECELNGQVVQKASTSEMLFPIPRLIAELSLGMTLLAGDIILTGTPGGVGFARTPPLFLRSGDAVVVRVSGIGEIRNVVTTRNLREYAETSVTFSASLS